MVIMKDFTKLTFPNLKEDILQEMAAKEMNSAIIGLLVEWMISSLYQDII